MICCPKHPDDGMLAIECEQYTVPVDLHVTDQGVEIEYGAEAAFMREMSTSVTLAFKCANRECSFAIKAEDLREWSKRISP